MRAIRIIAGVGALMVGGVSSLVAQNAAVVLPPPRPDTAYDAVRLLVARLDLERYKATIKGLTKFGDRRQGTDRNRAAADWIEAQLRSYGCAGIERLTYEYQPPSRDSVARAAAAAAARPAGLTAPSQGGGRPRAIRPRTGGNRAPLAQQDPGPPAATAPPPPPGARP